MSQQPARDEQLSLLQQLVEVGEQPAILLIVPSTLPVTSYGTVTQSHYSQLLFCSFSGNIGMVCYDI